MTATYVALGQCCMGFDWLKAANGFVCAGGSHSMSNDEAKALFEKHRPGVKLGGY